MSNRQTDLLFLRRDVLNAENAVIALNRQINDAIIAKRATGDLSAELAEIIEARDFMRARLTRLEQEQPTVRRQDQDRQAKSRQISVNEHYDHHYWSKKFGVTLKRLKQAVETAGPLVKDIAALLGKRL